MSNSTSSSNGREPSLRPFLLDIKTMAPCGGNGCGCRCACPIVSFNTLVLIPWPVGVEECVGVGVCGGMRVENRRLEWGT